MKNLVYILYIFCGLLISIPAPAQDCVSYSYDSAGNRIYRAWTSQRQSNRAVTDSLVPVLSPEYIDSLSPKIVTNKVVIDSNNIPLVLSEEEKQWLNEEFFRGQMAEEEAWWKEYEKRPKLRAVNTTYSVGAIPLQEGVSPTGARTYSLTIPTASGFKLVPNISLGYNSQAAEGWAGYGWDIQGISCIRLINKNQYYHGEIKAADIYASNPVFALDGMPLVRNEHPETSTAYPLETARGHILVKPLYVNSKLRQFRVLYPNGICAIYGHDVSSSHILAYYYITEMQDLEGNKISFSYNHNAGSGFDRLEAIHYGYDSSDNYNAEITFSYTNWTDAPLRYFAGVEIGHYWRLTSIESRSGNETLAKYSFSYQQQDYLWLLNRIECSSGDNSLSPIEFTYKSVPSSHYLKKSNQSITLPANYFSTTLPILYKRGKFMSGDDRDGIMIYPGYPTYERVWDSQYEIWRYGAFAPEDKPIIFIPRLENNLQFNTSLEFEQGFQTIDAVDVDGDGADELVKINLYGVTTIQTQVKITIYKRDDTGYPSWTSSFIVNLKGVHQEDHSPYNRKFCWGDFNGDGRADLLAIAYSTDLPDYNYGRDQTCYTAIIDIASQSVLSDEYLFYFPHVWENCLIVNDIDSDGRTELCITDNYGFKIYRLQPNDHFSLEATVSGINATILSSTLRPCYLADINGDGYLDIARAPASTGGYAWTVYYYTGNAFDSRTVMLVNRDSYTDAIFMDVNRDGMADLVTVKETSGTSATLGTCMNETGYFFGSFQESPSTISDAKGIVPANISAYNKPSSFIKFDGVTVYNYSYNGITEESRHITMAVDSYGKRHHSSYAYLPSNATTWSDNSLTVNNSQGFAFQTLPIYVLSSEYDYLSNSPSSFYNVNQYQYYNGVVHKRGLGFCGFSKIRTRVMVNVAQQNVVHDYTDVYYLPEKMGVVDKVERKKSASSTGPAYYTLTNTWSDHSTTYGKLNPRLTRSVTTDALTGVATRTDYYYDSWDYPTEIRIEKRFSGQNNFQRERHTYSYQHSNTSSNYVLGNVTNESTWKDLDGSAGRQWKNKVLTTYDTLFHPLTRKSYKGISKCIPTNPQYEIADSTLLMGETRWTYDTHGNVLTEKSAPYDATEFIGHTYTYDSNGRYLLTDTDALGHTTTYANYNKFGHPEKVTDYRNRDTYYSFDAWGKRTFKVYPTGSIESTVYAWGGNGAYTITRNVPGEPQKVTHYDALDREVRSGVKRFDGQFRFSDTQYNRYGQVRQTSLPFRGTEPTYWNTYTYDNYDRPIKILEPSGKETTWSYSGSSVTTVKDGIISVSTKDASGNVVSVQDAGGTITYTLRDDGQPSKITAPGNVETSFTYDSYGRRTSIIDPSAGTRTEAYVWNADGSHQQTHTGPNGSITTSWDKYGRTTSVVRPGEFNTTYTYNTYGLLSNEQSTNGTGTEYTYDSYDRISTVKETVPDSKWFKKTYTYSGVNTISTVKYTTQNGDITTETYSYANGQNTGVNITGGTTVWSLVSENDLGQPIQITTGSISRQYGFTEYGLPAYRKMAGGSLQNFTYQFNVNNGNLTSRTDVINNKTESFKYDALNRLDTLGTRVAQYANNGNILSLTSVGSMSYANTGKPYQVSSYTPVYSGLVPSRTQEISYNSLDRPSVLTEGYKTATFTYNAAGDRVKMQESNSGYTVLTRYYIGGQYEYDSTPAGIKERLYLGGDAYSAPMVLQRTNGGSWTAYNIGRDYLGSITHIATSSGTLVAEYSYDPWGRLRNPATQAIYTPGTEPTLFLGRGYTGHEHLTWFGLINMNARLYDPLLGRFLSPDPYVQAPDFTQNFNRYSYALNNPLKYTDESGEWSGWDDVIAALVGGAINWAANGCQFTWEGLAYFGVGAASGIASLYVSPVAMAGVTEAANSIIRQGMGNDGKWRFDNVRPERVLMDGAMGAATSYLGGRLSSALSNSLGNITSKIPGKAWEGLVNRGLTGAGTGFIMGTGISALNQYGHYQETGQFDWDAVWTGGWKAALTGLAVGGISGMAEGIVEARAANENPWALSEKDLSPSHIPVEYKSLGAKAKPFDAKRVSDTYLKQNGIDPHMVKYEYLGRSANISHYNLYLSKEGQVIIFGGKGIGEGIPTSYWIHKK